MNANDYQLDPTPASGEEILNEEDEQPLILVTNADISPTTGVLVKPGITFLGLASICIFALGSFSFNEEMMNQLSQTPEGFDGLYDLSLPLALAMLSTQLAHEAGHLIFALKERVSNSSQNVSYLLTSHVNSSHLFWSLSIPPYGRSTLVSQRSCRVFNLVYLAASRP